MTLGPYPVATYNNMIVRNSYQIVKVFFNSLCVSKPLREIELAKWQSSKEKNESSLKIVVK
jgi:hypothetical protein